MPKYTDKSTATPDPANDQVLWVDDDDTTAGADGTLKRSTLAAIIAAYAGHINLRDSAHSGIAGDVWDDGNALHYLPVTDERSVMLANGVVLSSTTVSNTTSETTVYTETISANELYKGSKWHVKLSGVHSTANAQDTWTGRLKIGGTAIQTVTIDAGNVTDQFWSMEFFFTVRGTGAAGTVMSAVEANTGGTDHSSAGTSTDTVDTTIQEDMTLTIQWDAADTDNTLTITQGHTEIFGVKQS